MDTESLRPSPNQRRQAAGKLSLLNRKETKVKDKHAVEKILERSGKGISNCRKV
jgi:hypothetical protein